jgi:aminoglycoside 6'-N-acetyltransferase
MAVPHALKHREGRACENPGFEKAGMVDTPDGPALLMVRNP